VILMNWSDPLVQVRLRERDEQIRAVRYRALVVSFILMLGAFYLLFVLPSMFPNLTRQVMDVAMPQPVLVMRNVTILDVSYRHCAVWTTIRTSDGTIVEKWFPIHGLYTSVAENGIPLNVPVNIWRKDCGHVWIITEIPREEVQ